MMTNNIEECEQRDGLHRLTQPHLVSQDAADAAVVPLEQPSQALPLVGLQRPAWQNELRSQRFLRGRGLILRA